MLFKRPLDYLTDLCMVLVALQVGDARFHIVAASALLYACHHYEAIKAI